MKSCDHKKIKLWVTDTFWLKLIEMIVDPISNVN